MSEPKEFFGPTVAAFDRSVDALLDRYRHHALVDRVFYSASAIADWSLVWHLTGALQALGDERRFPDLLRLSGTLGVESLLVNQGIKRLFHRPRPVFGPEEGPVDLRIPLTSSFPSGHASAAFCAAVLLSRRQPRMAPAWFVLASVVASSRVYVRMHFASDVVVGSLIGAGIGLLAQRLVTLEPVRGRR